MPPMNRPDRSTKTHHTGFELAVRALRPLSNIEEPPRTRCFRDGAISAMFISIPCIAPSSRLAMVTVGWPSLNHHQLHSFEFSSSSSYSVKKKDCLVSVSVSVLVLVLVSVSVSVSFSFSVSVSVSLSASVSVSVLHSCAPVPPCDAARR